MIANITFLRMVRIVSLEDRHGTLTKRSCCRMSLCSMRESQAATKTLEVSVRLSLTQPGVRTG